jgi:two-component system sensor histidine kinase RegB
MARPGSTGIAKFTLDPYVHGKHEVNLNWLIRLRWVAVFGQVTTIALAAGPLGVGLPTGALLSIAGLTAGSNAFLWALHRWYSTGGATDEEASTDPGILFAVMLFDVVSLTALLFFSGGPSNPCALFYFVNLALSAVALPSRTVWAVLGATVVGFSSLFLVHVPVEELRAPAGAGGVLQHSPLSLYQIGLLASFAVGSGIVVYFVTRLHVELRRIDDELREAGAREERMQRLESLATLAAGAGHELASPLSTIAVVAKELARTLDRENASPDVLADVDLIRTELQRCRTILDRMSGRVGQQVGETERRLTAAELVSRALAEIPDFARGAIDLRWDPGAESLRLRVPLVATAQALRVPLQNALDAGPTGERVEVAIRRAGQRIRFEVRDRGRGIAPENLARVGEPFFTTKEPGSGMGLGVYLARSVLERLGGTLTLAPAEDRGTIATIELPIERVDVTASETTERSVGDELVY